MNKKLIQATFGAGCFWHVEETFRHLPGVIETVVGYSGGTKDDPTYEDVSGHETGHAEAVQITYDPQEISYEKLLDEFWNNHNPTTKDRQGPDIGNNYRSVIFYHDEDQKRMAEKSKDDLAKSGKWKEEIVTEIAPAGKFWRAEDYHQQYYEKNGISACGFAA